MPHPGGDFVHGGHRLALQDQIRPIGCRLDTTRQPSEATRVLLTSAPLEIIGRQTGPAVVGCQDGGMGGATDPIGPEPERRCGLRDVRHTRPALQCTRPGLVAFPEIERRRLERQRYRRTPRRFPRLPADQHDRTRQQSETIDDAWVGGQQRVERVDDQPTAPQCRLARSRVGKHILPVAQAFVNVRHDGRPGALDDRRRGQRHSGRVGTIEHVDEVDAGVGGPGQSPDPVVHDDRRIGNGDIGRRPIVAQKRRDHTIGCP